MRTSIRYSTISRISGAVAGLWLCGSGAAWAGGSGDFGSLRQLLTNGSTGLCDVFPTLVNPCPIPPSLTQMGLAVAALGNNLFEMLLLQNDIKPATRVEANNPAATATDIPPDPMGRPILPTASSVLSVLSSLTPLAFISQSPGTGTAPATQSLDPSADNFLYAVGVSTTGLKGSKAPLPVPNYVYFFYDDLFRNNVNFANGATVAKFTFPLRVLTVSSGVSTERAVPTTLNFVATNAGDCSASTVSGNFSGAGIPQQLPSASAIGINCHVVLSGSPASAQKHAIFEVAVPLLVTSATDALYFYSYDRPSPVVSNPVNSTHVTQGVYTAFQTDTGYSPTGSNSTILGSGSAIGLAPSAAPLCSDLPGVTCGTTALPSTFPLCAILPSSSGTGTQLRPSIGAFYAMATSGETLLAAGLADASTSTCSLF